MGSRISRLVVLSQFLGLLLGMPASVQGYQRRFGERVKVTDIGHGKDKVCPLGTMLLARDYTGKAIHAWRVNFQQPKGIRICGVTRKANKYSNPCDVRRRSLLRSQINIQRRRVVLTMNV